MKKSKYNLMLTILSLFLMSIALLFLAITIEDVYIIKDTLPFYTWYLFLGAATSLLFSLGLFLANLENTYRDKKKAYKDITGVYNKQALMDKLHQLQERNDTMNIGIGVFDLNNLKMVNDTYGHETGDELIRFFASYLTRVTTERSFLSRFGGDEFVFIQEKTSPTEMERIDQQLSILINEHNEKNTIPISYAYGYEVSYTNHYFLIQDLMEIADQKMYENKKERKSLHTTFPLQLASREIYILTLQKILSHASADKTYVFISCDIDHFHFINDMYGYDSGNQVLKLFSEALCSLQTVLYCFRIFSDNFGCLLETTETDLQLIADGQHSFFEKIGRMIRVKYPLSYFTVHFGLYPLFDLKEHPEFMLTKANLARKYAKTAGFHYSFYTNSMEKNEQRRSQILSSFHQALLFEEFQIYFQPKISSQSETICGAEVLVRWKKDGQLILRPDIYIPILEQSGDIIALDFYVYQKTFQWISSRIKKKEPLLPISLNVSKVHFCQGIQFLEKIRELLTFYQIPPELIVFEITETAYYNNAQIVNQLIHQLHQWGIKVSMDDFGSGFSTLSTLCDISFDEIKLDKEFLIKKLSYNSKVVIQELIHLLKKLNKTIVCEGVETKEVAQFLIQEACHEIQGYYYYKPLSETDFNLLLKDKKVML